MFQNILVGLDESVEGEAILPHVEVLAKQFHSKLTLVHVNTSLTQVIASSSGGPGDIGAAYIDPAPILEAERSESQSYLEHVALRLREKGLDVDWVSPEGAPADRIVRLSDELGADLIAMVTHGRAGLERALLGSVSDDVVRHAHCPMLLVRAPDHSVGHEHR